MKRLFAFGCSFTKYQWPTWADILGCQFEHFENWGRSGASNHFIMNSVAECHVKNQISKNDMVVVMWSSVTRQDAYRNRSWITPGNLYNQTVFGQDVIDLFDLRGHYLRDLAMIYMAHQLLEHIGCEYYMFSMVDIASDLDAHDDCRDILPFYQDALQQIRPSVHAVVFGHDWQSRPSQAQKIALRNLQEHYQNLAGPDWPEFDSLWDPASLQTLDRRIKKEIFNLNKWDWHKLRVEIARTNFHPTPLEHLEYLIKTLPEYPIDHETCMMVEAADAAVAHDQPVNNSLTRLAAQEVNRW